MHQSKLFRYLRTFNREEWKNFMKFLNGTVGSKHEAYSLFCIIQKEKSNLDTSKLKLDKVQKKHFPTKSRKSLLNHMSLLKTEIEDFWTWQELKEEQRDYEYFKLKALNRREFYKEANSIGKKIIDQSSQENRLDLWDNYYRMRVAHELYFSYNPIKYGNQGRALIEECFRSVNNLEINLRHYYRVAAHIRERIFKEEWEGFLDQDREIKPTLLLELLEQSEKCEKSEDLNAAQFIKSKLLSDELIFSEDLAVSFFDFTKNAYRNSYIAGNTSIADEYVNLILDCTRKKYSLYKGTIGGRAFTLLLTAILRIGSIQKAKEYLKVAMPYLPKENKAMLLRIAESKILLEEEQYEELINKIQSRRPIGIREKQHDHEMLLKAYLTIYDDIEFINTQIINFRAFLHRNKSKLTPLGYEGNLNFLELCSLMNKKVPKNRIKQKFQPMSNVYYRPWIEKRLKELYD